MKQWIVKIPEVHETRMIISANSPEQAVALVREGEGEQLETQYSYTLDHVEWPEVIEVANA